MERRFCDRPNGWRFERDLKQPLGAKSSCQAGSFFLPPGITQDRRWPISNALSLCRITLNGLHTIEFGNGFRSGNHRFLRTIRKHIAIVIGFACIRWALCYVCLVCGALDTQLQLVSSSPATVLILVCVGRASDPNYYTASPTCRERWSQCPGNRSSGPNCWRRLLKLPTWPDNWSMNCGAFSAKTLRDLRAFRPFEKSSQSCSP